MQTEWRRTAAKPVISIPLSAHYTAMALPILRAVGNRSAEAATLSNIGMAPADLGKNRRHWIPSGRRSRFPASSWLYLELREIDVFIVTNV
jgi:hypothetical protein